MVGAMYSAYTGRKMPGHKIGVGKYLFLRSLPVFDFFVNLALNKKAYICRKLKCIVIDLC